MTDIIDWDRTARWLEEERQRRERAAYIVNAAMRFRWQSYITDYGFQFPNGRAFALRCGCGMSECNGWAVVPEKLVDEHKRQYGHLR